MRLFFIRKNKSLAKSVITFTLSIIILSCQTSTTELKQIKINHKKIKNKNFFMHVYSPQRTLQDFSIPGPFKTEVIKGYKISVNPKNIILSDLFLSKNKRKAPLLIFMHGNHFSKKSHFQQARHLASWGFHSLCLNLPNKNRWLENSKRVTELSNMIYKYPKLISKNFNREKIILIGHSFGGSLVTLVASKTPFIKGIILLDPAVFHKKVIKAMKKIKQPTILLGADRKIFTSLKRSSFFKNISAPMIELSIKGATHTDAQLPSETKVRWGFDWTVSQKHQTSFLASIVTAALALSQGGQLHFAWHIYKKSFRDGNFKKLRSHRRRQIRNIY